MENVRKINNQNPKKIDNDQIDNDQNNSEIMKKIDNDQNPSEIVKKIDSQVENRCSNGEAITEDSEIKEKKEGAIKDDSTGSTEKSEKLVENVEISSTKVNEGTSVPDVAEILGPATKVTREEIPAAAAAAAATTAAAAAAAAAAADDDDAFEIPDDAFELPPELDIPEQPCTCGHPSDCHRCKSRITMLLSQYNRTQKLWALFSRVSDDERFSYSNLSVGRAIAELDWMDNKSLLKLRFQLNLLHHREAVLGPFKIEADGSFTL